MKIKTIAIDKVSKQVIFQTKIGKGLGIWKDELLPKLNQTYEVEFEILDFFNLEENMFLITDSLESMMIEGGNLIIQAKIENIESDNLIIIKLLDSILMLDGNIPNNLIGSFICFNISKMNIFDNNIQNVSVKNVTKVKPSGYKLDDGTRFLRGEKFPNF